MLKKIILSIVLIIIVVAAAAFSYSRPAPSEKFSDTLTIEQIANTDVPASWDEGQFVKLKNGNYDGRIEESAGEPSGIPNTAVSAELLTATTTYTTADFNNDGLNDIFVTVVSNSGGTGWFNYLVAYKNEKGMPVYAGELFLGDRIKVNKITFDKNTLTTDIITQGPGEGLCCGTLREVKTYLFDGHNFAEVK